MLSKSMKGRDNLVMILSSQRASYNKVGLGCQPDNNAKSFKNIYLSKKTNHSIYKCNYCDRSGNIDSNYLNKMHDLK